MHTRSHENNSVVKQLLPTGGWRTHTAAFLIMTTLGLTICSRRIGTARGFLTDDCTHLEYSYQNGLRIFPYKYLPGVVAHRPLGRDAITLLLKLFGENDAPIIWTLLLLHIINSLLVWQILYRLTANWWAALPGAAFFLLSASAYQPVYVPAVIFDLLSTSFLAGLLLLVSLVIRSRGPYRPWLLLLTLPLLLAAGKTKESALVVIIPLCLLVLTDRNQSSQQHSSFHLSVKETIQRLLKPHFWELVWVTSSTLLVVILALTVVSDYRGAADPDHPYHAEYSFRVLGRSFGYFIATLFFNTDNPTPMRPPAAYIIIFFTLLAALLLRSGWMLLGLLWFVTLLLPLAALKNHYGFAYYPYPANVGTALFVAGLSQSLESLWCRLRAIRPLRYVLPSVFIILLAQQSFAWLKDGALLKWYDGVHARRAEVVQALKAALPQPARYSKVVLVVPEVIHLDKNMSSFIRVVYHDLTLTCDQFTNEQEAERFLAGYTDGNVVLAISKGGSFEVRR
jgi:hypothetical protein